MLAFFHEDWYSPVLRYFSKTIQSGSTIELSQILIIETDISSQPWAFFASSVLINFKTLSLFTATSFSWFLILGNIESSDIDAFFSNLSTTLNSALDEYDNVIAMGDVNIDTLNRQDTGHSKLVSFCDVFGLSSLVTAKTCFTKNSSSSIDVILTNRPRCFQKTSVYETGISDYHGLVITVMKSHIPRLKPKVVQYRSYKTFVAHNFLSDVKLANFNVPKDPDQAYDNLVCTFRKLVDKHAPLKTIVLRGNGAPFMNRELKREFVPEVG